MCCITWWHFQWPWRTPNPVFKVMTFFEVEYRKKLEWKWRRLSVGADHMLSEKSQWTQHGTMFVDLDWLLNASSPLSASAELLVCFVRLGFIASMLHSSCHQCCDTIGWSASVASAPQKLECFYVGVCS